MDGLNLANLAPHFTNAEAARVYLEAVRWPHGPCCPKCGGVGAYALKARPGSKRPGRKGLYKCKQCRAQFTVTVGTIFEDSRIPLHYWLLTIYLMCASKKGISAHQLHRMFLGQDETRMARGETGLSYKSAWFMAHRIRYGMSQPPLSDKLRGLVEVDETYVGGKEKNRHRGASSKDKTPVVALVERKGRVRSFKMPYVTGINLKPIVRAHVERSAHVFTDGHAGYRGLDKEYAGHSVVDHAAREYVRGLASTNTVEGFFSLLKRGVIGTYHHVSEQHLDQYLAEFNFRYNERNVSDGVRATRLIEQVHGKRLTLKAPVKKPKVSG
jgi:transposase-like protein